jgi:hypothetical protein
MFFFFKKPKLHIDAFISEDFKTTYELAPIDYARNFYPDWWRKLEKPPLTSTKKQTNAKRCASIIDTYKKGIIIPMWCDYKLKMNSAGQQISMYANDKAQIDNHPLIQRKGFRESKLQLKHVSPWFIKCERNVFFNFNPDFMNLNREDFQIIPGMLEFYNQHGTNINFFIDNKEQEIDILFGDPLVHIVPLTEREIVLTNHLVTVEEHTKIIKNTKISFGPGYLMRRKYSKEDKPKCPFGFGSK